MKAMIMPFSLAGAWFAATWLRFGVPESHVGDLVVDIAWAIVTAISILAGACQVNEKRRRRMLELEIARAMAKYMRPALEKAHVEGEGKKDVVG